MRFARCWGGELDQTRFGRMRLVWLQRGEGTSGGEGLYGVFSTTRVMMQMVSRVFNALHYDHILTDSNRVQNQE